MSVITLISDWKQNDYYLAAIKGRILGLCSDAKIVDISHQVDSFSITQAAFIIRSSYNSFPKGSVHIIAVNIETDKVPEHIAVKYDGHYFICANDGLLSLVFESDPEEVVILENDYYPENQNIIKFTTFPALSKYTYAAVQLIKNGILSELGKSISEINRLIAFMPQIEGSAITGNVIYIDTYQNAITNISYELFTQVGKGRSFDIMLHSLYYRLNKINTNYNETTDGELLAIFNSLGLLEIAQKNGRAAEMLNVDINSSIRIKFF